MSCTECENKAAAEDYLCADCRSSLEGCVHAKRRLSEVEVSEMATVLEERVIFGPPPLPDAHYCECCGTVDLFCDKVCLCCFFYEEFPNGPSDYKKRKFVYEYSATYDLCPQCNHNAIGKWEGEICGDCAYANSLCKECHEVPALVNDTLCEDCRFWADAKQAQGEIVIYHGTHYRGNILACKVMGSDPKEGIKLALPPSYAKRGSFITQEQMNTCVKCKKLYINHWAAEPDYYPNECAPCAGAKVFPWAACILEWDQAPLDNEAASV
jgi:hypothetical protein